MFRRVSDCDGQAAVQRAVTMAEGTSWSRAKRKPASATQLHPLRGETWEGAKGWRDGRGWDTPGRILRLFSRDQQKHLSYAEPLV